MICENAKVLKPFRVSDVVAFSGFGKDCHEIAYLCVLFFVLK